MARRKRRGEASARARKSVREPRRGEGRALKRQPASSSQGQNRELSTIDTAALLLGKMRSRQRMETAELVGHLWGFAAVLLEAAEQLERWEEL